MKRQFGSILLLLMTGFVSAQTIYKIVTEDGKVVYSDQPNGNATPVTLKRLNSVSIPRATVNNRSTASATKPETQYKIIFNQPADQATVRNNSGTISVSATITPNAKGQFQLLMDGNQVAVNTAPSFTLQDVDRGAHTLQINYVGRSGKVLASSDTIEVFMHRASVFIRPN